ncbi:hypothetical protein KDD17_15985 [Sulfitobacter albidus]|uniref:Uncharacterized protein n=1 Tax=Sulfitobacter albidus TaxID=2829501 RepID=A0A975PM55_9RHOB|nr:hypothetical protein [Sulfitobacter albidus]QUJ76369.1 hypothetical protein KDD17_15985 [Sulfitobacter albidus]
MIFATTGDPPLPAMDDLHWRATARVGAFTMGASLFGPKDKRAVSIEGAGLLEEMIRRSIDTTLAG